jgi:GH35 family endo-1,4-beta-xylanase
VTLSYPNVRQVLTWSLTDLDSYTRSSFYPADRKRADGKPLRPHPFDDTLKPKPMFEAIRGALAHAPVRTAQTLP